MILNRLEGFPEVGSIGPTKTKNQKPIKKQKHMRTTSVRSNYFQVRESKKYAP